MIVSYQRFGGTCWLILQDRRIFFDPKMAVADSPETLVTMRGHIPEDNNRHDHRLKRKPKISLAYF
jgi:hypothetical protein